MVETIALLALSVVAVIHIGVSGDYKNKHHLVGTPDYSMTPRDMLQIHCLCFFTYFVIITFYLLAKSRGL